jgi:hypothetical protein
MTISTLVRRGALAAILATGCVAAPAAIAQSPVPFAITEQVDLFAPVSTFTATGALCPSGTFVDDTRVFAGHPDSSGKINLLNRSVYTCDDGSGTFNALKHVLITIGSDGSLTNTGPIQLLGGTGAFTDLTGHGVDNGHIDGETGTGVGQISGFVVHS